MSFDFLIVVHIQRGKRRRAPDLVGSLCAFRQRNVNPPVFTAAAALLATKRHAVVFATT